jgi:RNA 3'-phosphate cyclase
MLEIDGSYGEGGGQILRTAVSLSAVTNTPIKLTNIRAHRSNPGLAKQHITAIKAISKLCNGKYSELKPGIKTVVFNPGKIRPGKFEFDIGTAGSISLVLQACILPIILIPLREPVEIVIRGGTDVNWSPPIDYFRLVFLKLIEKVGMQAEVEVINRGYYPKGGGEVILKVQPNEDLEKLILTDRGRLTGISGTVHNRVLPEHIPSRILKTVSTRLSDQPNLNLQIDSKPQNRSPGTGIVLVAGFENSVLGASGLGAKGLPAEQVGENAADQLITEIKGRGAVDVFASDQLIPYLATVGGEISVREVTSHTKTNMWLMKKLLGKGFSIEQKNGCYIISFNK